MGADGPDRTLSDVTRRAVAEVERLKIGEVLREADGNRGRAAELLQISYKNLLAKLKEHAHRVSRSLLQSDRRSSARRVKLLRSTHPRPSSPTPIAVGSTKCSRAGDHLLVALRGFDDLGGREVADRRQRAQLHDVRRQRVAIRRRQHARALPRVPPRPSMP